jgi:putative ABC transport system permease protein
VVPKRVSGRAPGHLGEVVVNDGAAKKYHLDSGERIRVVVPNSAVTDATIVGIYRVSFHTGGYLGALFSRAQAMSLFTRPAAPTSEPCGRDCKRRPTTSMTCP